MNGKIGFTNEGIEYDLKVSEFVKNCPCSFCGRKSTARVRSSDSPKTFTATYVTVIASCDDHHSELKKYINPEGEKSELLYFDPNIKMFKITRDEWEIN